MVRKAAVVGAGVVGLSTALCLQKRGFAVTIISDRFGPETTSWVAGGVFLPYNRNVMGKDRRADAIEVVRRSWKHYSELEQAGVHGIMKVFGYQCYFTNTYGEGLPDSPLVWEVADVLRKCSVDELKKMSPTRPCSGWIIQTYIIQCQYYLPYLIKCFKENGGKVKEAHVNHLEKISGFDVIVNCAGLKAGQLCGDNSMFPAKGQIARVSAPNIKHFFHCEEVYDKPPEQRCLMYSLPQTDHLVLGGTYTERDGTKLVSEDTRKEFIKDLSVMMPSLTKAPILKEECGVRPCRTVLRLEKENMCIQSGRCAKVVHNYGHSGNGIALSWGTAELAAEAADSLCSNNHRAKL